MLYPGRIIKAGEQDAEIVKALKTQLNEALGTADNPALRLDPGEPHFGPRMEQAVSLFEHALTLDPRLRWLLHINTNIPLFGRKRPFLRPDRRSASLLCSRRYSMLR